tara:strand:+ start:329 stop:970 length:642 start_codon:yes stop_codon:yes gene_type:complete
METTQLETKTRKLHSNGRYYENYEFINPFYIETLQESVHLEIQEYISNLSDSDYKFDEKTEFSHYDGYEDKTIEKYRSCRIHYPKKNTILPSIGRHYFYYLNDKFWQYDLEDVFEFQLIKYDIGGNYNWHCDYGTAERAGLIRKLSMSIQLSPPENYDGGKLQVVNYANRTINIPTNSGTVVVFDSKLPHKVCPVTWGQRLSLVGWANGPRFR